MTKKIKFKVDENTIMAEIAERYPALADYLIEEYGFHCIGCPLSFSETIEEGAMVHMLDEKEKQKLIGELNKMIKKIEAEKTSA